MPSAVYPLRKVQFGVEPNPGSLTAATRRLTGDSLYTPESDRTQPAFQREFRAPQTDGGVETRRGSLLNLQADLDLEQLMLFLDTGLGSRTTTGSGPYTHTYDPDLALGPCVKAATYEFVVDDGEAKEYERRFGYGTTRRLALDFAAGQVGRLYAQVFGRAEQPATLTGGLAPLARTHISTDLLQFYVDTTWSALGSTAKSFVLRYGYLDLQFGLQPMYAFDGRADLDFTNVLWGQISGALRLTIEHNADAVAEVDAWRNRTKRFIRMSTSGSKSMRFDLAGYYFTPPRFSRLDDTEVVTLTLTLDYDSVARRILQARVVNDLPGI